MLANQQNGSVVSTPANRVNRVSSLFDRFFDGDLLSQFTNHPFTSLPIAMWDDEHHVYVEVDVPGLTDKDVEVTFHGKDLLILGERKWERKEGSQDNRRYGKFGQRITLNIPVDSEKIDAKLTNGVLSLVLPKSEAAKPRRIALRSE